MQEFTSLVQGNATLKEYAAMFTEHGCFSPHLTDIEKMKVQEFQGGVQPQIHNHVPCFRIRKFQELINVAYIVKAEQRSIFAQINLERKRTSPFTMRRSSDKRRIVPRANKGKSVIPLKQTTNQGRDHLPKPKFILSPQERWMSYIGVEEPKVIFGTFFL